MTSQQPTLTTLNHILIALTLLSSFSSQAEGQWYESGTLHKASIAGWKNASYDNKLATASDWTLTSPTIKKNVADSGDIQTNEPYAKALVSCIDISTQDIDINGDVANIAVLCMLLNGWLE